MKPITMIAQVSVLSLLMTGTALAIPFSGCGSKYTTDDALANGNSADECHEFGGPPPLASDSAQLTQVRATYGSDFNAIGKLSDNGNFDQKQAGWSMSFGEGNDLYHFSYAVTAPFDGIVDFVLLVKQGTLATTFLFQNVTLNIDGLFNSYQVNPSAGDFSHISGFIANERTTTQVPTPGLAGLLTAGLLGALMVLRRRVGT